MTKVLCKGGPYYWIKEPLTDFEQRLKDAGSIEVLAGIMNGGGKVWGIHPGIDEMRREILAKAPRTPALTKQERARERREYPDRYYLGEHEIYPMTPEEELAVYKRFPMSGPFTFHGGAPHRPSSPVRRPAAQRRRA
jgi:hypothetical protein